MARTAITNDGKPLRPRAFHGKRIRLARGEVFWKTSLPPDSIGVKIRTACAHIFCDGIPGYGILNVGAGFIPARFATLEKREGINPSPTFKVRRSDMNVKAPLQLPAASRYFDAYAPAHTYCGQACRAGFPDRGRDRLERLFYNPAVGPL